MYVCVCGIIASTVYMAIKCSSTELRLEGVPIREVSSFQRVTYYLEELVRVLFGTERRSLHRHLPRHLLSLVRS